MSLEDRLPPHNMDAEEAVLGSLLLDGELINSLMLESFDFYHEVNAMIFKAMVDLKAKGTGINQITVGQELNETDKLELIGGAAYLSHLISITPTPLDCHHYAEIVKKMSTYRLMIVAADKIARDGYDASKDVNKALTDADELFVNLRRKYGSNEIIGPKQGYECMMDRYNKLFNAESEVALPTGFIDLDYKLGGGFFDEELIVLAADSGLGKSTLAMNIAVNQCSHGNILFCSGEMTMGGLADREVASVLKQDIRTIRRGKYSQDLYDQIVGEAIPKISSRDIYYYEKVPLSFAGIKQAAIAMKTRHGLRSIFVDYLQKMELPKSNDNIYRRIGEIGSQLKDLAKELQVPVALIAQLGSDMKNRANKRPTVDDIYETKMIQQHADVVLLLYRIDFYYTKEYWEANYSSSGENNGWKGYYSEEFPKNIAEILIDKQRQGGGHRRVKVLWDDKHQRYLNLAKDTQEE